MVAKKYGEQVRISHAKGHAFVKGTSTVDGSLPPELAQGLFAQGGVHDVIVRMSPVPGELTDDRAISTPRGMALKVFDVHGPKLAGHEDGTTQDFVLDTGKVFGNSTMKAFLANLGPVNLVAPVLPDVVKGAVSKASEVANAAPHAVGSDSPKLDTYGHPSYHPLAEAYYSRIAMRFGDYVAKIAVVPSNRALTDLSRTRVPQNHANALRHATIAYFIEHPAEYEVKVQLFTDEEKMPIERSDGRVARRSQPLSHRRTPRAAGPERVRRSPSGR